MPRDRVFFPDSTLDAVEQIVGHRFSDRSLLAHALTHPSVGDGSRRVHDYERLEFLGDAVLGLVIVEEIFLRFPDMAEGEMTKLKIAVVTGRTLSDTAKRLELDRHILTGKSELGSGERGLRSSLENVYEALVGALYLDGGMQTARTFVKMTLGDLIDPATLRSVPLDHPKSILQERLQARGLSPVYRIAAEEGPPHQRTFTAEITIGHEVAGRGTGSCKKSAEAEAAREALQRGFGA